MQAPHSGTVDLLMSSGPWAAICYVPKVLSETWSLEDLGDLLCLGRHLHPASLPQAFHSWTVRLYICFKAAPPKTLCSGHPGLGFGGLRPLWGLLAPGHPGLSAKNSEYPALP